MTAAPADGLIDRDPQNLPVPLGGMAPVRVRRPRRRRALRAHYRSTLIVTGALAGALGIVLVLVPAPTAVSLAGDRLQVGGMVLTRTGSTGVRGASRFEGNASFVLAEHGGGSATAAAAWRSAGTMSSGVCVLRPDHARVIDECTFMIAGNRLTSVDMLDPAAGSEWQRTYDDGVRVTIVVASDGGPVPVPFPIGH